MLTRKRKPASVGEILVEEFMEPEPDAGRVGRGGGRSAQARKRIVQQPAQRQRSTTLILARVFGNSPDFWLNVQRRSDL
jgi:antitoxin HigA-1